MTSPPRSHQVLAALVLLALAPGCSSDADREETTAIKRQLVGRFPWSRRLATVDDDDIQPLLRRFYKQRDYRPAWTRSNGFTPMAPELVRELERSPERGLASGEYDLPRLHRLMLESAPTLFGRAKDPATLAKLDVELSRNALKLATHLVSGQVNPAALPAGWHIRPRERDVVALLADALEHQRVADALRNLDPRDPRYARLEAELVRYRRIRDERGGWPRVPRGRPLARGQSGARVDSLQAFLAATDDLPPGSARGRFDARTEAAVRRFKSRMGLKPDGVVDADAFAQLSVPISQRIRGIELNLERWRWLPDSLFGDRYILVNVPDYMLNVFERGRPRLGMRVVVGKQFSQTPLFSDEITYLVFNPYWNVPPNIAAQEILAEVQEDPDFLERNGMRVFEHDGEDAEELDPRSIRWRSLTPETFTYAVRQEPGPSNAVGHVKFMCPNQFNVYLHDTPAGHLFDRRDRDFSHGCIRVERPLELAELLLSGDSRWSSDAVAAAFDTSHNIGVRTPQPMPVHILYWTSWVDENGTLNFRDDVYGMDQMLDRALRRRSRPDISGQTAASDGVPRARPSKKGSR